MEKLGGEEWRGSLRKVWENISAQFPNDSEISDCNAPVLKEDATIKQTPDVYCKTDCGRNRVRHNR